MKKRAIGRKRKYELLQEKEKTESSLAVVEITPLFAKVTRTLLQKQNVPGSSAEVVHICFPFRTTVHS